MTTLKLNNGLEIPSIGLGTWKSKPGEVRDAVATALRAGYRHIDCAWIYGNEREVGEGLREVFEEGTLSREEVWITSKLWNDRHAPEDVGPALQESLDNLGLEYLDLYLIHWPVAHRRGTVLPKTADEQLSLDERPLAETWKAMEELVDERRCRSIGVSNLSRKKLEGLLPATRIRPAMNQVELHPYLQQPDLVEYCKKENILLTAYSPLGSRDRASAMKGDDEPVLLEDPVVNAIAERHGSPARVLIAWALARGTVVIPKSVNRERIRHNLTAAEVALSEEEMNQLAKLDRARRYVTGAFWALENGPYTMDKLWDE